MVIPRPHLFQLLIGIICVVLLSLPIVIRETSFLVVSDQSLTEGAVQDFIRRDTMDGVHSLLKSWYTHPRVYEDGLVLHYPIHLYAIGVVGTLIFGTWMNILLPILAIGGIVALSSVLVSQLSRIAKHEISYTHHLIGWMSVLALLAPSWINGFRFELFYILFTLAGICAALKFYQTHQLQLGLVALVFFSFSAVLRQNYTLYAIGLVILLVIQIILFVPRRTLWKAIPLAIIIPTLVIGSYYTAFIHQAGTISYYSQDGYPVIDEQIFEPDYLSYEGLDAQLQEDSDIPGLFEKMNRGFQTQYPAFLTMVRQDWSLRDMYNTLNTNHAMNIVLLAVLIAISSTYWFLRSKAFWCLYMTLLVPYILTVLTYTTNPRYVHSAIFITILSALTFLILVLPRIKTSIYPVVFVLLTLSLFQNIVLTHRQEIITLTQTYWGTPTSEAQNAWPELMDWITDNTESNTRIFTPYQREVALHTEREAIWDARIWFVEDADKTLEYMDELFQADYVLIKSTLIRSDETYSNPMHIPETSTLYRMFQISDEFALVHQTQDFLIYQRTPSL